MKPSDIGVLGLVAGAGQLPMEVAAQARARGIPLAPINLMDITEPENAISGGEWISIGEMGKMAAWFRANQVQSVCFVGLVHRRDFIGVKLDAMVQDQLPKILGAAPKGDDALFRTILALCESEGFQVVGADIIAINIVAPAGILGTCKPQDADWADLIKARDTARAVGALDIGQGAVVCKGLVLAVEAQEGTDAMLQRCAILPPVLRGTERDRQGVLVKVPKPGQDTRVDLPTIGVRTVEMAAQAGLAGIGFAQNASLLVEQEDMISRANKLGMFLIGIPTEGPLQ